MNRAHIHRFGVPLRAGGGTPESSAAAIRKEQEQWRAFGKELNVEPQ